MSHWHSGCPWSQKCAVIITNPQGTYVNEAHKIKHADQPTETCEELLPKRFMQHIRMLGKPCEDRECAIYQNEQGISV